MGINVQDSIGQISLLLSRAYQNAAATMLDLSLVRIRFSEINEFIANCIMVRYDPPMSAEAYEISSEEVKKWVISRDPLRWELPMREQITHALRDMGFERVRVTPVIHHPVWNIAANVGLFRTDSVRSLKIALKKMCGELGFRVRMNEIVASLYRGRLNAAFALIPPNAAPVEVEHDGGWLPEHLEQPG